MNSFDSPEAEAALRRLVLARIAAGIIVVAAAVLAPPVADSIATLESSRVLAERLYDDGEPLPEPGVDVNETTAAPLEPLSTSY